MKTYTVQFQFRGGGDEFWETDPPPTNKQVLEVVEQSLLVEHPYSLDIVENSIKIVKVVEILEAWE